MLYHYTKDESGMKILKRKKIWATRSTSSNDEMDSIYIKDVFYQEMLKFETELKKVEFNVASHNRSLSYKYLIQIIDGVLDKHIHEILHGNTTKSRNNKFFVVCFTKQGDSRFLWDAYANDKGISLGIKKESLDNFLKENYSSNNNLFLDYNLMEVIYDREMQSKIIQKILLNSLKETYKNTDLLSDVRFPIPETELSFKDDALVVELQESDKFLIFKQWYMEFMSLVVSRLLEIAPFIKHPFWKEEQEVRLCFYRPIKTNTLTHLHTLKRDGRENLDYIEVHLPNDLISEVILGPLTEITTQVDEFFTNKKTDVLTSIGKNVKRS